MEQKTLSLAEDENEIGISYFQEQDFENAFIHWQNAYELGSIEAIYHLANLYYYGDGVEQDIKKAVELFLECASQEGNTRDIYESQFNLANAYYKGEGVEQNLEEAFKWYLKAADNGHVTSALNIAIAYFTGQGLKRDYQKSFKYAKMAADQEVSLGQYIIGVLYLSGQGCEQDVAKAKYYLTLAAEQGDENAQNTLANILEEEEVEDEDDIDYEEMKQRFKDVKEVEDPSELEDMTYITLDNISEVMENEDEEYDESLDDIDMANMTIEEVASLATEGNRKALFFLGYAYMEAQMYDEGVKYLSKSCAYNYPDALYYMGACYLQGHGVKKDIIVGMGHMAKAAKLNNINANRFLLDYYTASGEKEKAAEIKERLESLE